MPLYGGLGITVPPRHMKRKLQEIDLDESAQISRRPEVGVPNDGYGLGLWWSEAQRRPRGGL
ncbi:hypothetical protein OG21DRAFT_1507121 [Imleria badia]|nr:hypothetical protein OG21DRAFT_1507121 [Imleria badia]